jgi:hypothetical protein
VRVPLVPEMTACTAPNTQHVAPLAFGSCTPAQPQSSLLTTSSSGRGSGFARLDAVTGDPGTAADEADLGITASMSDVLTSAGADYAGQVLLTTDMRLTDRLNGGTGDVPGTAKDFSFSLPVDCVSTPSSAAGSTCSVSTTAETLVPGFATEGARTVMSAFSIAVRDLGPDGSLAPSVSPGLDCPPICGSGDEQVFLRQGVFAP